MPHGVEEPQWHATWDQFGSEESQGGGGAAIHSFDVLKCVY